MTAAPDVLLCPKRVAARAASLCHLSFCSPGRMAFVPLCVETVPRRGAHTQTRIRFLHAVVHALFVSVTRGRRLLVEGPT